MYHSIRTKKFEKSIEKIKKSGKLNRKVVNDIEKIIDLLKNKKQLPAKFKDHQLKGDFGEYRECHIQSDLLLVYRIIEEELVLVLVDIGTHSYLNL